MKRRIDQLSMTIERKNKEIQDKDKFIQNYLVNLSRKEDVPVLVA